MVITNKADTGAPMKKKRSFRSLAPTYSPSLVFFHGKNNRDQTFCTLSDQSYHVKKVPEMQNVTYVASCYGWILLKNCFLGKCYLFDPDSLSVIQLPPLTDTTYTIGTATSSPTDPYCFVAFFSNTKKSFVFCRIGDTEWVEQALEHEKKNSSWIKRDIQVISCNRKIYVILKNWIAVIDLHENRFATKSLHQIEFPDFSVPAPHECCENFVESCGDIFMVIAMHLENSPAIAYTFDVFKLDLSKMEWMMVESLGDRIFLVGEHSTPSMSVSATELGLQGNRIYYFSYKHTNLYRFDMDDGTTTISLPCPKQFPHWRGPKWVVPNCKSEVTSRKRVSVLEGIEGGSNSMTMNEDNCNHLPLDIAEKILPSLFQGDCIRFRLACKFWLPIHPPMHRVDGPPHTEHKAVPWLMTFPKTNKGLSNLYHPVYSDAYHMDMPELAGAIIRDARHGWLLMSRGGTVFFFHPITSEIIILPYYHSRYVFDCISFSCPPTSPDCVVFAHIQPFQKRIDMTMCRIGEGSWRAYSVDTEVPYEFIPSYCNPVFYDDVFFCLGKDGKLGVFNPKETENSKVWKVLPVPPLLPLSNPDDIMSHPTRCFIVEHDGEMISVLLGLKSKSLLVYKLDWLQMKWVKLDCLGNNTIFAGPAGSKMVSSGLKGIEDRIYFPIFYEEDHVYYSLAKGTFNCFGGKYSGDDWLDTREHWHCAWIQFDS